jgi:hypothetical protein
MIRAQILRKKDMTVLTGFRLTVTGKDSAVLFEIGNESMRSIKGGLSNS